MKNIAPPLTFILVIFVIAACGGVDEETLVVYSGRSEALVEPLVERFEESSDHEIEVRFGRDAQLFAALSEEGDQSPADVYWANTAGALAAAANSGLLTPLPDSITQRARAFGPTDAAWVPITARFRVLAYDTVDVDPSELPSSVMDLPSLEEFDGRIGWTPTYSSFQDFVTLMRLNEGPEATVQWLRDMKELNPVSFTSNTPMLRAMAEGEIDLALTNHYYVWRMKYGDKRDEEDSESYLGNPGLPINIYHFAPGDVGNLALVTGAGLLATSDRNEAALDFITYLLSTDAQRFATELIREYPVVDGVETPGYLIPIDSAQQIIPDVDYAELRDLEATLELLREAGVI